MEERVGQFVVTVIIGFTDNWDVQLFAVRRFLELHGVTVGGLTVKKDHGLRSAWQLRVSNNEGILRTAKKFLPHACKKNAELRAVVDYLEDRITGDELVRRANREVAIGNKTGKLKSSRIPYIRSEGTKLKFRYSLEKAHDAVRLKIPLDEEAMLRFEHATEGMSITKLAKAHGYSRTVIWRLLKKNRV
jgi:hypothetical protein